MIVSPRNLISPIYLSPENHDSDGTDRTEYGHDLSGDKAVPEQQLSPMLTGQENG